MILVSKFVPLPMWIILLFMKNMREYNSRDIRNNQCYTRIREYKKPHFKERRYLCVRDAGQFTGIDNYTWYFGDGHKAMGKVVEHTYARGGEYRVMAVGRHNETKVVNIEIIAPPPKVFISPHSYVGFEGDTVHFHANVTSYEENGSVVWYIKGHEYYGRDVNYTFTDDYAGYVICIARDSVGQSGEDRSRVIINNVPPKISGMRAYMYADITLRVAGKPHHRIHFEIYDDDSEGIPTAVEL